MSRKNMSNYYKSLSLNDIEYDNNLCNKLVNDYGHNLGSEKKQIINYEKIITNPKFIFNKDNFYERK